MYDCRGPDCSFCNWRKDNPIELGWERLLEDSESNNGGTPLCGVDLTCSQLENPHSVLSTQQTADFIAQFDDDDSFPKIDTNFENILSQYDLFAGATLSLPAATTIVSTAVTTIVSSANLSQVCASPVKTVSACKCIYSSPKGNEAVNKVRVSSIPIKTRDQTDWTVRVLV